MIVMWWVQSVLVGGQHFKLAGPPHPLQSAAMAVQMRTAQDYWFARHVKKFRVSFALVLGFGRAGGGNFWRNVCWLQDV